jgi:hypothetical protein
VLRKHDHRLHQFEHQLDSSRELHVPRNSTLAVTASAEIATVVYNQHERALANNNIDKKLQTESLFTDIAATATLSLKLYLPWSFSLTSGSQKSDEAWRSQWQPISNRAPPNGGWAWPSSRLACNRDPARFCAAMWCQGESELCGLLLARLNNTACLVEMVEGSPNPNHTLRGMVIPMALELSSMYAQAMGRREVWVPRPANDMLFWFLLNDYGFELVSTKRGSAFCRKEV